MELNIDLINQVNDFIIYFVYGIIIGILFDIFRILRKSFKTSDIITYLEDILFIILTGISFLYLIFIVNSGNLRFYIFLSIIIGIFSYYNTLSKYFIKCNVKILNFIKQILKKILFFILFPINLIKKTIKKVFKKIFLNKIVKLKDIFNKLIKNIKNKYKYILNLHKKKDYIK